MEFVYLMTNEHIPELVKFGFSTRHPDERAIELSSPTGVPGRWVVAHYWEVVDGYGVEQEVFKALSTHRIGRQEFFRLTPDDARKKISALIREVGTNPREEARQRKIAEQKRQDLIRADEERKRAQAEQQEAKINAVRREIEEVAASAIASAKAKNEQREKRIMRTAFALVFAISLIFVADNSMAKTFFGTFLWSIVLTAGVYFSFFPFWAIYYLLDGLFSFYGDKEIDSNHEKAMRDAEQVVLRRRGLKCIDGVGPMVTAETYFIGDSSAHLVREVDPAQLRAAMRSLSPGLHLYCRSKSGIVAPVDALTANQEPLYQRACGRYVSSPDDL